MFSLQNKIKTGGQVLLIPPDCIFPNPSQPRRNFDPEELECLAQSIRENGILQPLSVRPISGGNYELIAGERRLRASRLAGLPRVPCIISEVDDKNSAVFALIENIQRKDLAFFEEAEAINRLIEKYGISQEECAHKLGKAQSTLCNKLRLLKLPVEIRRRIAEAGLSERHARALLKLEEQETQKEALNEIIKKNLNVYDTDKLIARLLEPPKARPVPKRVFKDVRIFINTLNHAVDLMKRSGIKANTGKRETDEYIEYTIQIPKTSNPL